MATKTKIKHKYTAGNEIQERKQIHTSTYEKAYKMKTNKDGSIELVEDGQRDIQAEMEEGRDINNIRRIVRIENNQIVNAEILKINTEWPEQDISYLQGLSTDKAQKKLKEKLTNITNQAINRKKARQDKINAEIIKQAEQEIKKGKKENET